MKFKRQEPIGPYFGDFVCHLKKLIIELDGGHHGEEDQIKYDQIRTEFLERQGYKVIRFWNAEVFTNIEGVLEALFQEIFGSEQSFAKVDG